MLLVLSHYCVFKEKVQRTKSRKDSDAENRIGISIRCEFDEFCRSRDSLERR